VSAFSGPELAGHIANRTLSDRQVDCKTERCACGGVITADVIDPGPEVLRHNRSLRHLVWWAHMEAKDWEQE